MNRRLLQRCLETIIEQGLTSDSEFATLQMTYEVETIATTLNVDTFELHIWHFRLNIQLPTHFLFSSFVCRGSSLNESKCYLEMG